MKDDVKAWGISGVATVIAGGILAATGVGLIPGLIIVGLGLIMTGIGIAGHVVDKIEENKQVPPHTEWTKVKHTASKTGNFGKFATQESTTNSTLFDSIFIFKLLKL